MPAFGSTRSIQLMEIVMIRKSTNDIFWPSDCRANLIDCLSTPFTTDLTELLASRSRKARSNRSVRREAGPNPTPGLIRNVALSRA
jgi:hypothetical protein